MPTLPTDLQDAIQEAVIGAFGVEMHFKPMKAGEYVASTGDTGRQTKTVQGTFRHETAPMERQGQHQGVTSTFMGPVSVATVAKSEFGPGSLSLPKKGDHLEVLDGDWPEFRVAAIGEDGKGRFVFTLEKVG